MRNDFYDAGYANRRKTRCIISCIIFGLNLEAGGLYCLFTLSVAQLSALNSGVSD